ncbi:MAG: coenzyme F420-0:L-glutamate ligase [Bacillota bacterium]|nr:coenzyme F420-0:L-glutamate ligase [Bacillota bacterium]
MTEWRACRIPIRTRVLTPQDDLVAVVREYCGRIAQAGDIVAISESVVAITQGRAIRAAQVRAGWLARFLCRFPAKHGSLATPAAMQLAINEVGAWRVLAGAAAAALGRLVGRRGDFYRVAGPQLKLIDDIAGTMPPFDDCVVLGPRDPAGVARRIRRETGIEAVIVDVNDLGCVDILGASDGVDRQLVERLLRDNPGGNDDQQTPFVILRPGRFPQN